jgi:hypothetical protein
VVVVGVGWSVLVVVGVVVVWIVEFGWLVWWESRRSGV